MIDSVAIQNHRELLIEEFLQENEFFVERITDSVLKVNRTGELPVYINVDENQLFFEIDLGNVSEFASQDLYYRLLDLNTEILPVSVGIDSTQPDDARLVLVESRESQNLDDNELMAVFNSLEIAVDKVEEVLSDYVTSDGKE
ncbi:MAG: hypothetical protein GF398_15650 [Chitinivibrionales bacterium]|nr:hypothetical protein [Chitinivibrionales bacterium]